MARELFDLDGRVALVVGAGSGIGRASASLLAAYGATTVCADRDQQAARKAAEEICREGGHAEAQAVDLLDDEDVSGLVGRLAERHGRLDVAVTTPSVNVRKAVLDYSSEEFDRVISLNLKGTFRLLAAAGRMMTERHSGSLIAFSSIRSQVVEPGQGIYAATKAATVQLVRALAAELGPSGVRANAIAPGVIDTPLTDPIKADAQWYRAYAAKSVFDRWGTPEEVAGAVLFLASDASTFVTGTVLFVDGGWTAVDGRFSPPL
ncbi:MAG: SDR family oxidoreductase [Actinomycetota bacterium]|nr:SDR family oxidoreductase [Actinomycetota bacterium]